MPRYTRIINNIINHDATEFVDVERDSGSESDDEQQSWFPTADDLFNQRMETRYRRRHPQAFRKIRRSIKCLAYLQFFLGAALLALWKVADWKYFWHPYFRNNKLGLTVLSAVFFAGAALIVASLVGMYSSARWNSWVSNRNLPPCFVS